MFDMLIVKPVHATEYKWVRNYKRFIITQSHIDKLIDKIKNCNLNEMVDIVENNLRELLKKHCPLVKKRIVMRGFKSWVTPNIKRSKRYQNDAEKKWRKYKDTNSWNVYKKCRNIHNNYIRQAKINYMSDQVMQIGKDSKKLYKLVNKITSNVKENQLPNRDNDCDLANEFVNFFKGKIS